MTLDCASVRERLAELGVDDVDDGDATEIRSHVAECAACRDVQRSLEQVDLGLRSLAPVEPPSALVERTLAQIAQTAPAATERVGLLAILGAVLGGVRRGIGTIAMLLFAPFFVALRAVASARAAKTGGGPRWAPLASVVAAAGALALVALGGTVAFMSTGSREAAAGPSEEQPGWLSRGRDESARRERTKNDRSRYGLEGPAEFASGFDQSGRGGGPSVPEPVARPTDDWHALAQRQQQQQQQHEAREVDGLRDELDGRQADQGLVADPTAANQLHAAQNGEHRIGLVTTPAAGDLPDRMTTAEPTEDSTLASLTWRSRIGNPFADRGRFEGLAFQDARGYWANTYVPGDPALRSVYGRLVSARGAGLGPDAAGALALAEAVANGAQPFDAPTRAALGLYVRADRSAIEGAGRVLLQVGLRASARAPGQRPALGVVIVLDLRQAFTPELWARVQALLESASRARAPEDRFGVVAAGPHGGSVIAQGTLRHGEIVVAMQRLRDGTAASGPQRPAVELEDAVRTAMASLASAADARAPSASGLIWIVTPGLTAGDASLERVAHLGALGGITTSVLAVGDAGEPSTLESVVLAGQGRRVRVGTTADAERVVRSELEAGGNVVARAVRLRIRLAPGVQLVDILGSHRLDDAAAERVREAERAADVRLARDLGITQDRGKDEDGVQMVVPTFFADDTHVILLDLVVAGPGPVAEVSARYKDLLRLRNATASESFSLTRGTSARGPLERNVVANFVARELANVLAQAGDRAAAGATGEAAALLRAFAANVGSVSATYPELAGDARIAADRDVALGFARVLDAPSARGAAPVLADSLRLASYRRLLRPALANSP